MDVELYRPASDPNANGRKRTITDSLVPDNAGLVPDSGERVMDAPPNAEFRGIADKSDTGNSHKVSDTCMKVSDNAEKVSDTRGEVPDSIGKSAGHLRQLLDYVRTHQTITSKNVEDLIGIKEARARRILRSMVLKGVLEKRGNARSTCYVLKQDPQREGRA